ncbi:MAG: carboxymuconolactone decarboxylase family protein [Gemmatimonadota bacterium]
MTEHGPNPMEVLQRISPEGARTYMQHRGAIMENAELSALPSKTKLLVGIGVASALQSERCTLMWTKQARAAGASDAEIVEAILTARLMKAATVNDAAATALEWLQES